ncbi:MAG: response regulator [Candidatus Omnitrophica bacterium]|nr:response regulator [Candidatus Omnitrophota bacterium]
MSDKIIMVVDDEEDILALLEKKLAEHGFRVIVATRGRDAIQKAKSFLPGLILMDIVLPDIGGPEAVKLIKEDPATRHIPVIFLSGIVSKEEEDTKMGVQVDGVRYRALAKPFFFQDLYSEVERVFSPQS